MSLNLPGSTLQATNDIFSRTTLKDLSSSGNVDAAGSPKEDEGSEIAEESEEEEEKQVLSVRPAETTISEKDVLRIQKKEKKSMPVYAYEEKFQKRAISIEAEEEEIALVDEEFWKEMGYCSLQIQSSVERQDK
ncbi:hypothetical protein R1flu_017957 [Riccia fluitans]|uniref:Uncharacterized protein n=1 Tax=Riccia fluitans TaxID=41844 RepID=A0ABD1ZEF6_9MARC